MIEEPTNRELYLLMQSLTKKSDKGFTEIQDRLDKLNGQVYKNTKLRWSVMAITGFTITVGLGKIISILI